METLRLDDRSAVSAIKLDGTTLGVKIFFLFPEGRDVNEVVVRGHGKKLKV
jgi:hypothetical protein